MKRNGRDLVYYLTLVCVPMFFAVLLGLYLSKLSIDKHVDSFGSIYLKTLERKIDSLTNQARVLMSDTSNCDSIRRRLKVWPSVHGYLTVKNGQIMCQSDSVFDWVDPLLVTAGLTPGIHSYPKAGSANKERVLVIVSQDNLNPASLGMAIVSLDEFISYMDISDSLQYEKLAVWIGANCLFDRSQYDFDNMHYFKSERFHIKLGIEPTENYICYSMLMFTLSSIPLGLLISLFIHLVIIRLKPRCSLVEEIKSAVKRGEFYLVYQPVYDAMGELYGFEALARWQHPKMGVVGPDIFIPAIEKNQLGIAFTYYVFARAAQDMALLEPGKNYHLGINVPPEFIMCSNFESTLSTLMKTFDGLPVAITLEVTERQLLDEAAIEQIDMARRLGVKIAIDDFGVGHTSLSMLQRLNIDYLKIDKCFVDTVGIDSVNAPVLESIIELAHRLNITIVAEGVESAKQVDFLNQRGCQYQQGYFYAKPLTMDELLETTAPRI
ncbi:EAL domain-containing protein [Grimontia marina]|uniref:Putative cyclic-di-GMP phosphodiesterase AdrB n=1 Tax=Grimontia marina TaxID=646534 RepID=A0A128F4T8_9GAMM|nr:EAL domain-containing protein [Grimontia marina]CZF81296.1 Putative cyclic-di-GMP phosphodiesterase AdrB [Grimontia marina]